MTRVKPLTGLIAGVALIACSACQTQATMTPASLSTADAENVDALKATLASAMGRASVEIMETDLTSATYVSVLPPPLGEFETHSLAMPVLFDIMMEGKSCLLVRQDTGERYDAPGVTCLPVAD